MASMNVQDAPEKNALSFAHDNFGTVCRKTKIITPKCSAAITF